jgi:hypothetical protein
MNSLYKKRMTHEYDDEQHMVMIIGCHMVGLLGN